MFSSAFDCAESPWAMQPQRFFVFSSPDPSAERYFSLDLSWMNVDWEQITMQHEKKIQNAFDLMSKIEAGECVNVDENRQVGHYWLRNPALAPTLSIREEIEQSWQEIEGFIQKNKGLFSNMLIIGIGGSALGPQLLASACGVFGGQACLPFFLDNTDPQGMKDVFERIRQTPGGWSKTLVIVLSKSGKTQETHNGQEEVRSLFASAGIEFVRHAVAVTTPGSQLHQMAHQQGWLAVFPLWDWVGGRTSICSAVGLLPGRLMGLPMQDFLRGAREMDAHTRVSEWSCNPAMLLALSWMHAVRQNRREMVVLPYKDRLALFSRYLQQLIMESLGKEVNLLGQPVHEGVVVYGNKGSTDQHAYVQQLRDGADTGFVNFIQVLRDSDDVESAFWSEDRVTSGDFLLGFLLGTRKALAEKGRPSLTMTVPSSSPYWLGALIALYERAVGYYAGLVGINAYHQPGVEAGKQGAVFVVSLQKKLLQALSDVPQSSVALAWTIGHFDDQETVFAILEHLASNRRIERIASDAWLPTSYLYKA